MYLRFLIYIALVIHLFGIEGSRLILDNYNIAEENQVDIILPFNIHSDESSDDFETDESSSENSICKTIQWDNLDKTLVDSLVGMGKVDIDKMKQEFKRINKDWEQSDHEWAKNMKEWFSVNQNHIRNLKIDYHLDNFLSSINKKELILNNFDSQINDILDDPDRNEKMLQLQLKNMNLWNDCLKTMEKKNTLISETFQLWSYISQEMLGKNIWVQKSKICKKHERLNLLLQRRMKKIQRAKVSAKSDWKKNIIRILSWQKLGINKQCIPKALEFQLECKTVISILLKFMKRVLIIRHEAIIMEDEIMKDFALNSTYDLISRSIFNDKKNEHTKKVESMTTFKSNMRVQWDNLVFLEKEHKNMNLKCEVFTKFMLDNKKNFDSEDFLKKIVIGEEGIKSAFYYRHNMIKYFTEKQLKIKKSKNNNLTLSGNLLKDITEMQKMIDQDLCFDDNDILLKNYISKEYFHKVSQLLVEEDWDLFCWNKELDNEKDNEHVQSI